MSADRFFDTNVLIYALADDDPKAGIAEKLLADGGLVSVQVLNEFVAVARRKLKLSWSEVNDALNRFRVLCPPPVPLTVEMHDAALRLAERFEFGIYDATIVAAALRAGCTTLYTEDLQDGQLVDGQLTIRNPFAAH